MIDKVLDHPMIPAGCVQTEAHSRFGGEIGYIHYVNEGNDTEEVYCLGLLLEDKHTGAPKRAHGGVTMAMLDEVMGRAASKKMGKLCFTATMTTNFCAAARIGDFLLATARILRCEKNLVFIDSQLHAEEKLIATATGAWINSQMPVPGTDTPGK